MTPLFGGIEAGGTKFVCLVGRAPDDVRAEIVLPTTTPDETLQRAIAFFRDRPDRERLQAIGIATFGPADLDPASPRHGWITDTPKRGWRDVDIAGHVRRALPVPVAFETDVNAAAMAEARWGAGRGCSVVVYVTVGTGVGGGVAVGARPLHGLVHPEMGHMRVPHDRGADAFAGSCPAHGDCLEGLASGPAMAARWGQPAHALPDGHPAWDLEARYVAFGLANVICAVSPERVIVGGGVMQHPALLAMVRRHVHDLLNGYPPHPRLGEAIDELIVPPALGTRSGAIGALALAMDAVSSG